MRRTSKTGVVIGADERVDVMTALRAIATVPAWQYNEEASKGSIEVGKRADLVILDANPVTAHVDDIPKIAVVETFKDGRSIYTATRRTTSVGDLRRAARRATGGNAVATLAPRIGCACDGHPSGSPTSEEEATS